jgi:alpha-beta hydrolase superfamily lysophospholipase
MAVGDIGGESVRDESQSVEAATSASPPSSGVALAKYGGRRPSAPNWFRSAVAALPEPSFVDVEGAKIEYLVLGKSLRPGLLLVPGRRANVYWWAPLMLALARDFRVATLSLSGMGQSGWRHGYSTAQYSREIKAVAEVAGLFDYGPPILIAHSFGASPASAALACGWPGGQD